MNPRICKCCGQPITTNAGVHSLNPNLCDACAGAVELFEAEKDPGGETEEYVPAGSAEREPQFGPSRRRGARRSSR